MKNNSEKLPEEAPKVETNQTNMSTKTKNSEKLEKNAGEIENTFSINHFMLQPSKLLQAFDPQQFSGLKQAMQENEEKDLQIEKELNENQHLLNSAGKKRGISDISTIYATDQSEEPSAKKKKLNPVSENTEGFQWGSSSIPKRENFIKINLKKGKGKGKGYRPTKFSRKASNKNHSRTGNANNEPQADSEMDFEEEPLEFDEPIDQDNQEEMQEEVEECSVPQVQVERSDKELKKILNEQFGHPAFRPGQLEAIKKVLSNQSCLVCIPTGTGKSLIYQFPALLAPKGSIILVISPLLSLINDQLKKLPACLPGASVNSSHSSSQITNIIQAVRAHKIKILFVSPEKLMSNEFLHFFDASHPDYLGVRVEFVCIDEAHCISQWSHNFRPSYLRVSNILQNRLQVSCFVVLSATCTYQTRKSICDVLPIDEENIIVQSPVRHNLSLSVSSDFDKYTALLKLFASDRYKNLGSIIIYCSFQQQTEQLAAYLQSNQIDAMAYHAGKSHSDRKQIENLFMSDKLRVVVATVAFGMGIDKCNVRAVIHFTLPQSTENYVQEVGRAGRDNMPAYGHLFLNYDDVVQLYKLLFTTFVDRITVKNIFVRLFTAPKDLGKRKKKLTPDAASEPSKYLVSFPYEDVCLIYDVKKEVLDTLFTYLQLNQCLGKYLNLLTPAPCLCTVSFHATEPHLLRNKYQVIDAILDHATKAPNGKWRFNLVDVANQFSCHTNHVKEQLDQLHNMEEISYKVEEQQCYLISVKQVPTGKEIDNAISEIYQKILELQHTRVKKLYEIFRIAKNASYSNIEQVPDKKQTDAEPERELDYQIEKYFEEKSGIPSMSLEQIPDWPILDPCDKKNTLQYLKGDIIQMLSREGDKIKSGLIGARILAGISSPTYPSSDWYKHSYWARYPNVDFFKLEAAINQQMALLATKQLGN